MQMRVLSLCALPKKTFLIEVFFLERMSDQSIFDHSARQEPGSPGLPVLISRVFSYEGWSRVYLRLTLSRICSRAHELSELGLCTFQDEKHEFRTKANGKLRTVYGSPVCFNTYTYLMLNASFPLSIGHSNINEGPGKVLSLFLLFTKPFTKKYVLFSACI